MGARPGWEMRSFPDLLESAGAGDPLALHDLYEQYAPLVGGYVRGQGADDPDDLTSEVFVGMIRGLDTFSGTEESFRSWLLVIAHRRLIDERRRLSRQPCVPVAPEKLQELGRPQSARAAECEAIDQLSSERVLDALGCLTALQRDVVLLHTIGGLPLARVAKMLDKRVGAVKSLHRRALATVARSLARESAASWRDES